MKIEKIKVWGFEHALRGMRNPLESWPKSDSEYDDHGNLGFMGTNDLDLCKRLIQGGPEHRKFLRQIFISMDVTAPLYWWKEFDTYKVGTVANSTSTMHKLASTSITKDCFEMDDYENIKVYDREPYNIDTYTDDAWEQLIEVCETLRERYLKTKDVRYWKELIRWLPESWLQTRTVTMNYENAMTIYKQRKYHKLSEWNTFLEELTKNTLYLKQFISFLEKDEE